MKCEICDVELIDRGILGKATVPRFDCPKCGWSWVFNPNPLRFRIIDGYRVPAPMSDKDFDAMMAKAAANWVETHIDEPLRRLADSDPKYQWPKA